MARSCSPSLDAVAVLDDTETNPTASTGMAFVNEPASSGTCWMIIDTLPSLAIGVRTVVGATLLTRMKWGAR